MKNLRELNWNKVLGMLIVALMAACATENVGPVLGDKSTYTSPVLTNAATKDPMVFTVDKAADNYETFTWQRTSYGEVQLSTDYVVQIDTGSNFKHAKALGTSSADNLAVTVEQFNNSVLGLGIPGFTKAKVHLRLRSTVNSFAKDTLYSNAIERTITTYQVSECGDYCTVGIIGDATPGGWGTDTDMHLADPKKIDKHTWTVVIYLTAANAKFRASDDWTTNWGTNGTLNGPNIPIANAGYYKVTFNDQTGASEFKALAGTTFSPVSIIGDATAGGWNTDTDLTQDGSNPHIWTGTVSLTAGGVKFRANHDWTTNWGSTAFPSGSGVINGDNINAKGNTYFVWFNDVSGEYSFGATATSGNYAGVSLIGPGASDWNTDVNLTKNPNNSYLFSQIVTMNDGDTKFRKTGDWGINWGGSLFPSGIGLLNGPNIPAKAGKYFVTINSLTGEYYFLK